MSDANKIQVGGAHYQSDLQHWDLIELHGIGYLEGCATKYVTRWRKKNGVQDLQKAEHYATKLRELFREGYRVPRGIVPKQTLEMFQHANELTDIEHAIVETLCRWEDADDLDDAITMIQHLIRENTKH